MRAAQAREVAHRRAFVSLCREDFGCKIEDLRQAPVKARVGYRRRMRGLNQGGCHTKEAFIRTFVRILQRSFAPSQVRLDFS